MFSDVAGVDEAKEELEEIVVSSKDISFIQNKKKQSLFILSRHLSL